MSKEKPEVDDIWFRGDDSVRVLFVSETAIRFIGKEVVGKHPMILTWSIDRFKEVFIYLGKAEAGIFRVKGIGL